MLPGFRFLFAAIVLCVSILVFGLGAAALLRAAHEEFASKPSWRGAPEITFTQPIETTRPVIALMRVEPKPAEPAAGAIPTPAVTTPAAVTASAAVAPTAAAPTAPVSSVPAAELPAQAGETTAALSLPEAQPSEAPSPAPSPLLADTKADAPKPAAPTETARSDVALEIKADTGPQTTQDEPKAPVETTPPPSAAITSDNAAIQPAETKTATTEDAEAKTAEPKTSEDITKAAEAPPAATATINAAASADTPAAAASAPAPVANAPAASVNSSASAANGSASRVDDAVAPQASDAAAKVATGGDPTATVEPQSAVPAIDAHASAGSDRNAIQKQLSPQLAQRARGQQQQRRRLAPRTRVVRQQSAAYAAQQQQQYAFPIQQQQPPQTFTPMQRPPGF